MNFGMCVLVLVIIQVGEGGWRKEVMVLCVNHDHIADCLIVLVVNKKTLSAQTQRGGDTQQQGNKEAKAQSKSHHLHLHPLLHSSRLIRYRLASRTSVCTVLPYTQNDQKETSDRNRACVFKYKLPSKIGNLLVDEKTRLAIQAK